MMGYISRSCDLPQIGISKKGKLMAYISKLHNYQKLLNAQKFGKIPNKFQKLFKNSHGLWKLQKMRNKI
jgi:hypothetical protein